MDNFSEFGFIASGPGKLIRVPEGETVTSFMRRLPLRSETLLLRSRNVSTNRGHTLVPRTKLAVRYTRREGDSWSNASIWPNEYLAAIRTGRLGPMQFAALQIIGGWIFDRNLQRLYYNPWRYPRA